ncbi:MAG: methylmalonyl-CoA mutase family protein [Rhodothalassiaceae bacterium]
MSDQPILALAEGFETPDRLAWEALVDKALGGADRSRLTSHTADGLSVEPLYAPAPGTALAGHAAPWLILQRHDHPDLKPLNRRILTDLERGVTGIRLTLDPGLTGHGGALIATLDDLDSALDGVLLDLAPLYVQAGVAADEAAALLAALVQRRGLEPESLSGSLCADPFLARMAGAEPSLAAAARLAQWASQALPGVRTFELNGSAWLGLGATEAQELALCLAASVDMVRALDGHGAGLHSAARQIGWLLAADADLYLTIAKMRAARLLWARLMELVDGPSAPLPLAAETARRMLTRYDPWTNLLRHTIACVGAGVGGADAVTVAPHDAALGTPSEFALRLARNLQIILQEESNLFRVADPVAGAGAFEALTDDLAAKAWQLFTEIERTGGLMAAIEDGLVTGWLTAARKARAGAIAKRRPGITGVSAYPDLAEKPVQPDPVDAAALAKAARVRRGAAMTADDPVGRVAQAADGRGLAWERHEGADVPVHRVAEPFEQLRDRTDGLSVFVATLGPLAGHTARTGWVKNALAAGGFAAQDGPGGEDIAATATAFEASGCRIAVISGSDAAYETHLGPLVEALSVGGRAVWKAGRPAATDPPGLACLYQGGDLLAALTQMEEQAR